VPEEEINFNSGEVIKHFLPKRKSLNGQQQQQAVLGRPSVSSAYYSSNTVALLMKIKVKVK